MYRPSPSRPPSIRSRSKLADDRIELYHPTGSPVFGGRTMSAADKRAASRASRASGRTSPTDTLSISDESLNLGHVESHIEDINAPFGLRELEMGWQFFQPYLKSEGYVLRPRYRRGWIGSWVGTDRDPLSCEDSIVVDSTVIDAIRAADNKQVLIKVHTPLAPPAAAYTHSAEIDILRFFAAPPHASDPRNHCVPLLDVLQPEEHGAIRLSVMPLLRDWCDPPMRMAVEALAFVRQLLEGLAFMHEHGIAHCNITARNILMDASQLFPEGFHGAFNMNPTHRLAETHLPQRTRLSTPDPVRYFFIDFALAVRGTEPVCWRGGAAVPEAEGGAAYDPFPADVYALGAVFDQVFRQGLTHLEALHPLFAAMCAAAPARRPTAASALAEFDRIACALPRRKLRARLGFREGVGWKEWRENVFGYWALLWMVWTGGGRRKCLEF